MSIQVVPSAVTSYDSDIVGPNSASLALCTAKSIVTVRPLAADRVTVKTALTVPVFPSTTVTLFSRVAAAPSNSVVIATASSSVSVRVRTATCSRSSRSS